MQYPPSFNTVEQGLRFAGSKRQCWRFQNTLILRWRLKATDAAHKWENIQKGKPQKNLWIPKGWNVCCTSERGQRFTRSEMFPARDSRLHRNMPVWTGDCQSCEKMCSACLQNALPHICIGPKCPTKDGLSTAVAHSKMPRPIYPSLALGMGDERTFCSHQWHYV